MAHVTGTRLWAGGGHRLLAGSPQVPRRREGDHVLPLTFVRVVYVKCSQPRTREGEGGLPSPADWMGNNDPLFIASSIVPENPF